MKMKILAVTMGAALTLGGGLYSPAAHATGIPVVDAAMATLETMNHGESIAKYIQQIAELKRQYDQAKQQYESLTGGRGMGSLARSDSLSVPTDWRQTLQQMQGGQVGSMANQVKQQASRLDTDFYANVDGKVKEALDYVMQDVSNGTALNASVYQGTGQRQQRLTQMANSIDGAADMKAIADLQARIASEQSMLLNELIRVQSMNAMAENNRRVQSQRSLQESNFFGTKAVRGAGGSQ